MKVYYLQTNKNQKYALTLINWYIHEQDGNEQDEGKHTEEGIHGQHSKQTYLY